MICTVQEASTKICVPLSKAFGMEKSCVGEDCMAWEWMEQNHEQEHEIVPVKFLTEDEQGQVDPTDIIYVCMSCKISHAEQSTCHKEVMTPAIHRPKPIDPGMAIGYCTEIKRSQG